MKQKKKKRKRRIGAVVKFLMILVLLATALAFTALSPLFNIKSIVVRGCTRYNESDIAGMSGIVIGQNAFKSIGSSPSDILRLRFGMAEKTIEEKCPYIKSIKAKLAVPSTVVIEIVERQQAAVVPHLGTSLVIDREGDVLEVASGEAVKGLINVRGLEFERYQTGKPLPLKKPESLVKAFELLDALKQADEKQEEKLVQKLGWIDSGDPGRVLMLLDNRITVNLGDLDDLNYKLDAMRYIFNRNIKKEDKGILDFTTGENPVFKPE
jgi:cell division protein FtsQ